MRSKERRRNSTEPKGELASRTLAMPADCNPKGDIFGGWIMALMDSAGKMSATPHAGGRVVTVSVSNITFLQPVHVGDTVCCYTEITRTGRTSITLDVEVVEARVSRSRPTTGLVMLKMVASNASGQALCEMVSPIIVHRRGDTASGQAG